MEEIWKDIPGYEGVYQASSFGRIKSVPRIDCGGRKWGGKILSQVLVKGYYFVGLNHNRVNKLCRVHRLVAQAFLPNPQLLPQVNHKDENPLNNRVENLEWCDDWYNKHYGTAIQRSAQTRSIAMKGHNPHPEFNKIVAKVDAVTLKVLEVYPSASEAARRNNVSEGKISMVCNGHRNQTGGYKWMYL